MNIHAQRILILDFGSQYTQLIARRIRELGVYSEIHPAHVSAQVIHEFAPAGIILSGGPESVTQALTPRVPDVVLQWGCPVLGICYGMQAMAEQLGGRVEQVEKREFGYAAVTLLATSTLFADIEDRVDQQGQSVLDVWMSHGDQVTQLPDGFTCVASTATCPIAVMADEQRRFYGIQFHPEVSHTRQGQRVLQRFLLETCQCSPLWTPKNIIGEAIQRIREQVGNDKVILGLSGGVDSAVAATLIHKAIGEQLTCVFVDTGLLRLNEAAQVQALFAKHIGIRLLTVEAQAQFFSALANIADPEQKRKIVGKLFIDIFEAESKKIPGVTWLAQGTIYPDVIESAATKTGNAHVIKSHHNVGGLPEHMQLQLLEPLRELFKDEVRNIGVELGLPYEWVYRHPFPGPGLAVRVLGAVNQDYVVKLQKADAILIEELQRAELYYQVAQAFAVFLPVKSVGVIGDARHYEYVIAIRAVETMDFMTAHWARLPYDVLETIANRITNEVTGISRVTYDISNKPPATIEWE
ncbi:MAG: glutamine-hydrolyzing GMP synthase [Gammaproteobacteria bacterium RIFCSPHIGHO2_12_FULL_41_20]|nr:MAG: glutamine-hydrolyzing GMP synthase [Gammaproteobacteria bacterium RIFCSPHIGHO2_12_FULL_41_20]